MLGVERRPTTSSARASTRPTRQIRVRNHVFRVLGVMASKGASVGRQNMDDQVFAPYTTVMKKLSGQLNLNRIYVSARSADDIDGAAAAITNVLRTRHEVTPGDPDDFTVQTLDDIVALRTQTTQHDDAACSPASRSSRSSSAASAS